MSREGCAERGTQSNVGRSIYRPPRLLGRDNCVGVKLQSRTQLVATGFDSSPPPAARGGHVIDACTHVHKRCICVNVEENHGTMSTTRLSVSNLVSLAFTLSPRSFSDAVATLLPIIMSRQTATIIPFSPYRSSLGRLFGQSRDLPPPRPVLLIVFICVTASLSKFTILVGSIYSFLPPSIYRPKGEFGTRMNKGYYLIIYEVLMRV